MAFREGPALRRYRQVLALTALLLAVAVTGVGVWLLAGGRPFRGVLALLVVVYLVVLVRGYVRDAEERS